MPSPFDQSGIARGDDGILRYVDPPRSLIEVIRASVERDRGAEAIVELGGPRLTYGEVWDQAAAVAGGLRAQGVTRGDRVAIHLTNRADFCLSYLGIQMAGGVVVPINTRFSRDEIDYVVEDSGASYVIDDSRPLPHGEAFVDDQLGPADMGAIFYTSGTTGFPKGAILTHANLVANTETGRRLFGIGKGERYRTLISVPLFHVTGCHGQFILSLSCGGTAVIMPSFNVDDFLDAIHKEQIDFLASVPAIYLLAVRSPRFAATDVSSVRWLIYGGAPISPDAVGQLGEAFPHARLGNGFGMTETTSVATFLPHEYCATHPDSVGLAGPTIELKIKDPDPNSGAGELLIRGPNVAAGYWNKPEATAETFVDGWLHSGDIAVLDDDGFLRIVDRSKDMVNRGGENVYSIEVENAIAAYPGVAEAAVVGVPDDVMGEKVGAVIVPTEGAEIEPLDLIGFLKGKIADFKVPEYVLVQPEPLPRNPGGKILKPQIRKEAAWGAPIKKKPSNPAAN